MQWSQASTIPSDAIEEAIRINEEQGDVDIIPQTEESLNMREQA